MTIDDYIAQSKIPQLSIESFVDFAKTINNLPLEPTKTDWDNIRHAWNTVTERINKHCNYCGATHVPAEHSTHCTERLKSWRLTYDAAMSNSAFHEAKKNDFLEETVDKAHLICAALATKAHGPVP